MQLYLPRGFLDESKATISELAISGPLFWQLKRYHAEAWWVYWRLGRWSVEVARQGFHGLSSGATTIDSMLTIVDGASELLCRYPVDKNMFDQFRDASQLLEIANSANINPIFATGGSSGYATVHHALSRLPTGFGRAAETIEAYRIAHPLPFRVVRTVQKSGNNFAFNTAYEILDSTATVIKKVESSVEIESELSTWMKMDYHGWREILHRESDSLNRSLGKRLIRKQKTKGTVGVIRAKFIFPNLELRLINEFNQTLAFMIQNPCLIKQSVLDESQTTKAHLRATDIAETSDCDGLVTIGDIEPLTPYGYSSVADRSLDWGVKAVEGEGRARHKWHYLTIRPKLCVQFPGSVFPERCDEAIAMAKAIRQSEKRDDTCRGSKNRRTQKGESR